MAVTTRKAVPYDCQTAYKDDEFLSMAGNMMHEMRERGEGKGVRQRYLMMMNSIKEKVADLGMTSSARRVIHKANGDEMQNKLVKMMKARRGGNSDDPESTILSPQQELR